MTSFYATLRTRSRGALPLLSADSSPLSEGQGLRPLQPPFRLPSSVTLFCGRSCHRIVFLKRTSFRNLCTPIFGFLQGFYRFLLHLLSHIQGNKAVEFPWCFPWSSWCFRGVGLVTDAYHAVPAPSAGNCPLSFSRSDRCNSA